MPRIKATDLTISDAITENNATEIQENDTNEPEISNTPIGAKPETPKANTGISIENRVELLEKRYELLEIKLARHAKGLPI